MRAPLLSPGFSSQHLPLILQLCMMMLWLYMRLRQCQVYQAILRGIVHAMAYKIQPNAEKLSLTVHQIQYVVTVLPRLGTYFLQLQVSLFSFITSNKNQNRGASTYLIAALLSCISRCFHHSNLSPEI